MSTNFPPTHRPLPIRSEAYGVVAPANDGRHLLSRSRGAGLVRLDLESGARQPIDPNPGARQSSPLAVSADGRMLAMVVDRTTIEIRHMPDGEMVAELHRHRGRIMEVSWAPTGSQLASLTDDGWVQSWNLAPWQRWMAAHHLSP